MARPCPCPWVVVDLSYLASSDPMAGKVGKKQEAPPLLLGQAQKMVKKALSSPAVQQVSEWALFNAFLFAASGAFAYFVDIPCSEV